MKIKIGYYTHNRENFRELVGYLSFANGERVKRLGIDCIETKDFIIQRLSPNENSRGATNHLAIIDKDMILDDEGRWFLKNRVKPSLYLHEDWKKDMIKQIDCEDIWKKSDKECIINGVYLSNGKLDSLIDLLNIQKVLTTK